MGFLMPTRLHRLAIRFSRRLVFKKRYPRSFGRVPILVSSEAGLKYILRKIEDVDPPLLRLVTEYVKPDSTVWDIGANLGLFTFASAAKVGCRGRVLAIEPDIWLVSLLQKTATLQPDTSARVDVLAAAVAAKLDIRTFCISGFARAGNHLDIHGSAVAGIARTEQTVVTLALDWLTEHFPVPQVLKIDVEGAELEVLQGGLNLISHHRPIIMCEVHSKNSQDVYNILTSFGYRLFDADTTPDMRKELTRSVWNTLALPQ